MQVSPLDIPDVKLITPKKFGDHRGFFSEVFNANVLREAGMVQVHKDAQRRVYTVDPEAVARVDAWLEPYRKL